MQPVLEDDYILFDVCGGICLSWLRMTKEDCKKILELDLMLQEESCTWKSEVGLYITPKSGKYRPEDFIPWLVKIFDWLKKNEIPYGISGIRYLMKDTYGSFQLTPWDYVCLTEWKVPNATWGSKTESTKAIQTMLSLSKEKIN